MVLWVGAFKGSGEESNVSIGDARVSGSDNLLVAEEAEKVEYPFFSFSTIPETVVFLFYLLNPAT